MQVSERNLSIPRGAYLLGDLRSFLIYQKTDRQNTSYLVGMKASVKVRDEVVTLGNTVERLLGVR